jgi:hypothetical protein
VECQLVVDIRVDVLPPETEVTAPGRERRH